MTERLPYKQEVAGSRPAPPTTPSRNSNNLPAGPEVAQQANSRQSALVSGPGSGQSTQKLFLGRVVNGGVQLIAPIVEPKPKWPAPRTIRDAAKVVGVADRTLVRAMNRYGVRADKEQARLASEALQQIRRAMQ